MAAGNGAGFALHRYVGAAGELGILEGPGGVGQGRFFKVP